MEAQIFATPSCHELVDRMCRKHMSIDMAPRLKHRYHNGCFEAQLGENVRNRHVFVVHTSMPDEAVLHAEIWELLQLVNAARKSSAREVTAVIPYLSYARSDKKWGGRMPIAGTLYARYLEDAGADRVVCIDLHSPQFQSAFDTKTIVDHLETLPMFARYLEERRFENETVILPGDEGFHKVADELAGSLRLKAGSVEKTRVDAQTVKIGAIHGDVAGKTVIIADDEILTAGTMSAVAETAMEQGAHEVIVVATHALFQGNAAANLSQPYIKEIIITDTVPLADSVREQLPVTVLSIDHLLSEAIKAILMGGSVSRLLKMPDEI